jgi:ABC-type tungstate transport system permease subunit
MDDLADAQQILLKRSVVVVQVHQTDAEKHFIQTGKTIRRDRQHMENFYNAAVYDLQDEIRDNT